MGTMSSWFAPWVDPTVAGSRTGGNTPENYNDNSATVNTSSTLSGGAMASGNSNPNNPRGGSGTSNAFNNPGSGVAYNNPAVGTTPGYDAGSGVNLSGFTGTLTNGNSATAPPTVASTLSGNNNPNNPRGGLGTGSSVTNENTATPGTAQAFGNTSTGQVIGNGSSNGNNSKFGTGGTPAGQTDNTANTSTNTSLGTGLNSNTATQFPNIPTANPYGSNPFAPNPGFTGPYGPGGYGPQTFSTQSVAQQIAQQYGGTVVNGANTDPNNPANSSLLIGPGSQFKTNQTQYMIQMPNGAVVDPAKISSIYANAGPGGLTEFDKAQIQDVLNGSDGSALAAFRGMNAPAGTGVAISGAMNHPTAFDSNALNNPFTTPVGQPWNTIGIDTANALSGAGVGNSVTTPAGSGNINTGGGNTNTNTANQTQALDPATLQSVMQFLAAYQGLGAGAGNPQGVNQAGPLSAYLTQILGGLLGNNDLYSRRKVSQVP